MNPILTLTYDLWRNEPPITINVYPYQLGYDRDGRNAYTVAVSQGDTMIFPRGQLYCATWDSDPREVVTSLVAMEPGNIDPDYFADYTPEQLAWAMRNGEALALEAAILNGG